METLKKTILPAIFFGLAMFLYQIFIAKNDYFAVAWLTYALTYAVVVYFCSIAGVSGKVTIVTIVVVMIAVSLLFLPDAYLTGNIPSKVPPLD